MYRVLFLLGISVAALGTGHQGETNSGRAADPGSQIAGFLDEVTVAHEAYRGSVLKSCDALARRLDEQARECEQAGSLAQSLKCSALARVTGEYRDEIAAADVLRLQSVVAELKRALQAGIPPMLLRDGLTKCLCFREREGIKVLDDVTGALEPVNAIERRSIDGVSSVAFVHGIAGIETKALLGAEWTIVARASFPVVFRTGAKLATLTWGNHRSHVAVDPSGQLGVWDGRFIGSGADISKLRGWHTLVAVAREGVTGFFVDGVRLGESRAVVSEAITCLANSGDLTERPQNFDVEMDGIALYARALTAVEVTEVSKSLFP